MRVSKWEFGNTGKHHHMLKTCSNNEQLQGVRLDYGNRLMRSLCFVGLCLIPALVFADPPQASYIFPAGGQRGTTVQVRIGALNLLDQGKFLLDGEGIKAESIVQQIETRWFEGPLIRQPDSQRKEDYPKDYANTLTIDRDAPLGPRVWRLSNSQGVTLSKKFIVGSLPEIVEDEIDGNPIPTPVTLPVTINGRIYPREDIDIWTCELKAGQTVTCEVNAARLGSPLDSRLEVRGPDGRRIAENGDALGLDSKLRFTAPQDGQYAFHIHDVNFGGLQDYVYRLTITTGPWLDAVYPLGGQRGQTVKLQYQGVGLPAEPIAVDLPNEDRDTIWHHAQVAGQPTNGVLFDLSDLPEYLENETAHSDPQAVELPTVLNGRISKADEVDAWKFAAKKGEEWTFDVKASRLGSPLDGVLTLFNAEGKQIAQADDQPKGQTDPLLKAKIPADGEYVLKIQDRFASRGGPRFAYRIGCTASEDSPGFEITLPADAFTLTRGTDLKIKLDITRTGGLSEPIELKFDGLPEGITATDTTVPKNKTKAQITLQAADKIPVALHRVKLRGEAQREGQTITRTAEFASGSGDESQREFWLAVAIPTPFQFTAEFASKYSNRGSMFSRRYQLDRGGFEGPLEIRLADVQARHLQGVTAEPITLDPQATEFEYVISLPPWMEVGRTSRTCLMAIGTVTDFDGSKHQVCYSSTAQNDQMIILTDPERLGLRLAQTAVRMAPQSQIELPVEVQRGVGLSGAVRVDLVWPVHFQGISAEAITIPADQSRGTLTLKFGREPGPFNQLATVRARILDEDQRPVTAEAKLEIVTE